MSPKNKNAQPATDEQAQSTTTKDLHGNPEGTSYTENGTAQPATDEQAQSTTTKDLHGNPEGTSYTENGTAQPADMGLNNAPQPDPEKPILYNEDGSVFTMPVDHEKTIGMMKLKITELGQSIHKGQDLMKSAMQMLETADDEDKAAFDKAVNKQKVAIENNEIAKLAVENELKEFRLSCVTPAQRSIERELTVAYADRDKILARITELENKKKLYNIAPEAKAKAAPATAEASTSTDEQKANHEALVAEHGTQGKAIIALIKAGWLNKEIAKHMGIPPASVPGPKNAWIQSPAFEAEGWVENEEGRIVKKS